MNSIFYRMMIGVGFAIALLCFASHALFSGTEHGDTDSDSFQFHQGRLSLKAGTPFAGHLEVITLREAGKDSSPFRMVGQIIALANPSQTLVKNIGVNWVELDPALSKSLGFLPSSWSQVTPGKAIGFTLVPKIFLSQIQQGERVDVSRYGLKVSSTHGSVVVLKPSDTESRKNDQSSRTPILFQLPDGREWYPGTNCEVEFPTINLHPVRVPSTAILHEGLQEYVFKEVAPNEYMPELVSIVSEMPDSAEVTGDLHPGDRLINSGAILLKPLLHSLLSVQHPGGNYASSIGSTRS